MTTLSHGVPEYDDPNIGVVDTIRPTIKNQNPRRSPYRYPTLQRNDGLRNTLNTTFFDSLIGSTGSSLSLATTINHEKPYPSSITLQSNGGLSSASYMTSPSSDSSIDYVTEIRHMGTIADDTLSITHDNDLSHVDYVESLTVDAKDGLHEKNTISFNSNSPAILRDPPKTDQMITERKDSRFRREIGSHLFRRMTRAGFASLLGIRKSPTLPTMPSSNGPYSASSVAFLSQGSSGKHPQAPVQHDHKITPTPWPKPGMEMSVGTGAQSQGAAMSRRRHGDDRQEMRSRQSPSSGTGHTQRNRSVSMDLTALPSAPLQSPGLRNRTTSMPTGQITAGRQGGRSRFPFALQSLLPNDFRFRMLVVGRRNSGKSSLIETIFNVEMPWSPINISGGTAEFHPRNNRHLIVHECSASGPGEMQAIRDFITTRNHESCPASERLYAIWACVPMSDVIHGQVDEGVKMLMDIGVPFVIVFTKFDRIVSNVSSSHNYYEDRCRTHFGNVPANIVSTHPRFRDLINKLVTTTDGVIIAYSRKIAALSEIQRTQLRMSLVPLAWSVSQRASCDINILTTIEIGRSKYWRDLWSSDDFHGQTLANWIEVIHADIVGVWNILNKDSYQYLSSKAFRKEISDLVQDLVGSLTTPSRPKQNGTGAACLTKHYENCKEKICLVVGYIVDLTLILCRVFRSSGIVSPGYVQSVINSFAGSSLKTSIHNDISSFIRTVPQLQFHNKDVVMAKIGDLISRYSVSG